MRLLLLAGTEEARDFAAALDRDPRVRLTVSLARPARVAGAFRMPVRIGCIGGDAGLAALMQDERIEAVVDATHPFAVEEGYPAWAYCDAHRVPYLRVLRRPWLPRPRDRWTFVNSGVDAARIIPERARVFIATGRDTMASYSGLTTQEVICRVLSPAPEPFPLPHGRWLLGHPPFDVASETRLFRDLGTEWLVIRNSGGGGSRPKLDAARELGIEVAMIRRPLPPDGPRVETAEEAVDWVRSRL